MRMACMLDIEKQYANARARDTLGSRVRRLNVAGKSLKFALRCDG